MDDPQALGALRLEGAPQTFTGRRCRHDDDPGGFVDGQPAVGLGEDFDQVCSTQRSAGRPSMLVAFFSV